MPVKNTGGFTLVEVLVISPIVILFIGAFITLIVSLTGESIQIREKNVTAYDTQATFDEIESSVLRATGFVAATGLVASPQGRNNATAEFNNTADDTLIIKSAATTKSPNDPTRALIYTGTGACDSRNPTYDYYTIYFLALDPDTTANTTDQALYRRTILPQTAACASAHQRGSCAEAIVSSNTAVCKTSDEKLLTNVASFNVDYFSGSTSVTNANAATATSISVAINSSKQVSGSPVSYNSSISVTSQNVITADSAPPTPAPAPSITWTRNDTGSNPYQTVFSWQAAGNATGYTVTPTIGGVVQASQNIPSSQTSFPVEAGARKRVVSLKVDVTTNSGSYNYGTQAATQTPRWNTCGYINTSPQPSWTSYGSPYLAAGFTKTSAGIVGLRGLVAGGTIGNSICNLPPEFRPSHRLIFQTAGYRTATGNGWARVDVLPNGNVIPIQGENPWVSLDGVTFVAAGANWGADAVLQNSWTHYGGEYSPIRSLIDSQGRVQVQGLERAGTLGNSVVHTSLGAARGSSPTIHMPAMSGAFDPNSRSIVQVDSNGNILGRVGNEYYQSLQLTYYPSSFAGWRTLTPAAGWANYGGGWPTLQCHKAADDLVVLRGLVARPSAVDGSVLSDLSSTSPTGGCGAYGDGRLLLSGWMSNESVARFDIAGNTLFGQFNQPAWNAIDGVHFIAD